MERDRQYFPAIDSLRAIAVVGVVLYHLDKRLVPGGFIGVDVFFVVSGFVVSLTMARTQFRSLASFALHFYARRLLRIAPALVVCLLLTTVASCLFIPHAWLSDANWKTGLAAFAGVSNLVLSRPDNAYFEPRAEFNPFTHTWSLGVEEQFYLVFPFLFYFAVRTASTALVKKVAILALAALAIASLVCSAWWTQRAPNLAFYLTPSRFWELACGVGLFMSSPQWRPWVGTWREGTARSVGLLLLIGLAACMAFTNETGFPFPFVIGPVACTVGLIALIFARPAREWPSWMQSTPVLWLGRISYSLYLWHWPVQVLCRWTIGLDSTPTKVAVLAISLLLAGTSYRWVEHPARSANRVRRMPAWRQIATALSCVALGTGLAAGLFHEESKISLSVTSDEAVWEPGAAVLRTPSSSGCRTLPAWDVYEGGAVQSFREADCPRPKGRLYVIGDSHAGAYAGMLRLFSGATGREVFVFTRGGCNFFNLREPMSIDIEPCQRFRAAAFARLQSELRPADVLFLPSLRIARIRDQWGATRPEKPAYIAVRESSEAVKEAISVLSELSSSGATILFEAPKPIFKSPPFRCSDWFNARNQVCGGGFELTRANLEVLRQPALASIAQVMHQLAKSALWDPAPTLCPDGTCRAYRGGEPLFFDGDHLSGAGNAQLLDDFKTHVNLLFQHDAVPAP